MSKLICVTAVFAGLIGTGAFGFEMQQTVTKENFRLDYPYRILGAKPGITFEELKSLDGFKDRPINQKGGTYSVGLGNNIAKFDMPFLIETTGYTNFYNFQYNRDWDYILGTFATPAAGSVINSIKRNWLVSGADTPKFDAVKLQLIEQYGEPSYQSDSKAIWVQNADGELMRFENDPISYGGECGAHVTEFNYNSMLDVNYPCRVVFNVHLGWRNPAAITFELTDYNIIAEDSKAAIEQIDAELNSEVEATDLDL